MSGASSKWVLSGGEIAMLDLINRYCHGYVVLPAVVELNKKGFFDSSLYEEAFSIEKICQERGINLGYLSIVFRSMLAMGLIQYEKDSGLWKVDDHGQINRLPSDLSDMLTLATGKCLQDPSLSPHIIQWIDRY